MKPDVLPGTLDLLILKTLTLGALHGYGIAQHIQQVSEEVLQVQEGSLYPALQKLQAKGLVTSEWATSPTGRRARYYRLTAAGERELGVEVKRLERMLSATQAVLGLG